MVLDEFMWWCHLSISTNSPLTCFVGIVRLFGYQTNANCQGFLLLVYVNMGGKKSRIEPHSCAGLRKKKKVWNILHHGNFTPFLERLHCHDPNASTEFVSCWHNRKI